jgi:hypothetical protein
VSRERVGRQRLRLRGEALGGSPRNLFGLWSLSVDAMRLMDRRCRPRLCENVEIRSSRWTSTSQIALYSTIDLQARV